MAAVKTRSPFQFPTQLQPQSQQQPPQNLPTPLLTVAHVTFRVPHPPLTARFLSTTLGLTYLQRPLELSQKFEGVWMAGYGMEVHLVRDPTYNRKNGAEMRNGESGKGMGFNVEDNHLAFRVVSGESGLGVIKKRVVEGGFQVEERFLGSHGIHQIFFQEPSSQLMIEIFTQAQGSEGGPHLAPHSHLCSHSHSEIESQNSKDELQGEQEEESTSSSCTP